MCIQVPGYVGHVRCPPRAVLCTSEHSLQATLADEPPLPTVVIVNQTASAASQSSSKLAHTCVCSFSVCGDFGCI